MRLAKKGKRKKKNNTDNHGHFATILDHVEQRAQFLQIQHANRTVAGEATELISLEALHQEYTEACDEYWESHATNLRATAADRRLDELYGSWRPLFEEYPFLLKTLKHVQRQYHTGAYNLTGPRPLSLTSAVILLFMMRGRVPNAVWNLAFLLFLVGLQPWALVVGMVLLHMIKSHLVASKKRMRCKVLQPTKPFYHDKSVETVLQTPIGCPLQATDLEANKYDIILVGTGIPTLYTAALLSRAGHKVLVLSSHETDACGCIDLDGMTLHPTPHDWTKIDQQQELLAPALCSTTDAQGGIRFVSNNDAYGIVEIPGVGTSLQESVPLVLDSNLVETAAEECGDGWDASQSYTHRYLQTCPQVNASAGTYYLGREFAGSTWTPSIDSLSYAQAATQTAQSVLNAQFPLHGAARSFMAGLTGMSPTNSMATYVSHTAGILQQGWAYPLGGPRAIGHALATVVEQCGGCIAVNVPIDEYQVSSSDDSDGDDSGNKDTTKKTSNNEKKTVTGIRLKDGTVLQADTYISMESYLDTFCRHWPTDHRPTSISSLADERPVLYWCLSLDGTTDELELTATDYTRLPSASRAVDQDGQVGTMGWAVNETKFIVGSSYLHVSFSSAKDPSFAQRHAGKSTCVVTIQAPDEYCTRFDSQPALYSLKKTPPPTAALQAAVRQDLLQLFPQLDGTIRQSIWIGPVIPNAQATPERFAAVRCRTPWSNLYYGGPDLTVPHSVSAGCVNGWLVANLVLEYSDWDLFVLAKNVTNDLGRWVPTPDTEEMAIALDDDEEEEAEDAMIQVDDDDDEDKKNK